ncbi:XRE family transcriptional regulator [Weissella confusa]|uniref:helix-turn-helix transcriptional regulator n=1 Tax=Weissella confusa TaxID=1583 RepID=UPI00223B8C0B|nr:helix-turn-helix transcriptional regulator [Weissella confusa]MCT0013883.1 XRE family transcriptional regulator [Weissella confusa]MCT8397004.1 XRE family transcriptional regulator [Weissella confusa]UYY89841.1 helix-turn-helix transcriptional regulator [Weissella confusa]
MTVLERIKEVSKLRGYNLTKVNEMAHLGKNTIYSWKTKEPSHNNLQAVADVLGVSVDYLLGNTDEMHPAPNADKQEPINLAETVDDSERDNVISANGQPISDEDWAIIKAVLAKYPKRD